MAQKCFLRQVIYPRNGCCLKHRGVCYLDDNQFKQWTYPRLWRWQFEKVIRNSSGRHFSLKNIENNFNKKNTRPINKNHFILKLTIAEANNKHFINKKKNCLKGRSIVVKLKNVKFKQFFLALFFTFCLKLYRLNEKFQPSPVTTQIFCSFSPLIDSYCCSFRILLLMAVKDTRFLLFRSFALKHNPFNANK